MTGFFVLSKCGNHEFHFYVRLTEKMPLHHPCLSSALELEVGNGLWLGDRVSMT